MGDSQIATCGEVGILEGCLWINKVIQRSFSENPTNPVAQKSRLWISSVRDTETNPETSSGFIN